MINGKRVIVGVPMTNLVRHLYWPISEYSVLASSNTDFVDDILIVDGQSTDETVEFHSNISPKVKILKGPKWNTEDLSSENFNKQRNFLYDYCQNLKEDCILIFQCSDVFFTDAYRIEIKNVISTMINEKYDFCVTPFIKMLTPWIGLLYTYKQLDEAWYEIGITQFFKDEKIWHPKWLDISDHTKADRSLKKLKHRWQTAPFVYEAWLFDRSAFEKKIQYHDNWDKNLGIDDSIKKMYYWKINQFPICQLSLKEHPPEFLPILTKLKESHLGFSLFNHLQTPMSYQDFELEISKLKL